MRSCRVWGIRHLRTAGWAKKIIPKLGGIVNNRDNNSKK